MQLRITVMLAVVFCVGCPQPAEIKTETRPKASDSPNVNAPSAPSLEQPKATTTSTTSTTSTTAGPSEYQIIGAMFPAEKPEWFFKFAGKTEALAPHTAAIETLFKSVRFPNGLSKEPLWDTPKDWKVETQNSITRAIIRIASPDLQGSLTSAMGGTFQNVERWAGQLGVRGFSEANMTTATRVIEAQGVKGLLVDVKGSQKPPTPGAGGGMMMPR
jgi:hypothetical protein